MHVKKFLSLFESKHPVICVISGPSGAGKTTLLGKLGKAFKGITAKDLDDFDDEASALLKLPKKTSKEWTYSMEKDLADKRQELMDAFIKDASKPLVFGGIPFEDEFEIMFPKTKLFLLDVDAHTAALRAYKRSQHEKPEFRRQKSEIPEDESDASKDIQRLLKAGYQKASKEEISDYIKKFIDK